MRLDDFVMLGTTVPEPNSDGRIFVCSAGVSAERRSLVRIYPLARHAIPQRWGIYRIPVEANPRDTRSESYKIAGDRSPEIHERINERFERLGRLREDRRETLLRPYLLPSIKEANARRVSLALIAPRCAELHFELRPDCPASPQLRLFDADPARPQYGAARFPYVPRIRFGDADGEHDLMLRDWGCYELMRKHPPAYFLGAMRTALHLDESSTLLVGNLNQHRTSWLGIAVLNRIRPERRRTLFDRLDVAEEQGVLAL